MPRIEIEIEPQFETGKVHNGDLTYNIQMARRADGLWFQRHIWFDGERTSTDRWIKGSQNGPGAHMSQVPA